MSALWERCLLTICGGANLRAMSMNFIPAEEVEKLNATGWQNMNKNADVLGEQGMRLDRPCLPGGCCGVPFRIFVSSGGGDELGAFLLCPLFFLFFSFLFFVWAFRRWIHRIRILLTGDRLR